MHINTNHVHRRQPSIALNVSPKARQRITETLRTGLSGIACLLFFGMIIVVCLTVAP